MPAPGGAGGRPSPSGGGNGGNRGGGGNRGNRAKSTSTETDLLAQLMIAAQQAANQSSVDASIKQQAAQGPTFNPADYLAAKQGLDEAYKQEEQTLGSIQVTPGQYIDMPGTDPSQAAGIKEAQAAYDEQLRIRRADALNVDPDGKPVKMKDEIERLSWDEYNNLTPLQQAAVDYNSMLVKAVRQDRRNQDTYAPSEDTKTAYEGALEEMFGSADKGSEMYAPATMGVLRQIGYKGDGSGQLDDFLNLDATLGVKDLKRLDQAQDLGLRRGGEGSAFSSPVMEERMDLLGGLARGTENAQADVLARGNAILKNFSTQAMSIDRADDIQALGGVPSTLAPKNTDMAAQFDQAFNLLADADLDSKIPGGAQTVFATIRDQMTPKQQTKFIEYVKGRLVNATNSETKMLTDNPDVTSQRTPEELAKLLKLDGFTKGGA